ncbi:uncharacterized protein TRUGW13939_10917 [Talaromyces rugulosus]|uniref:Uncharacterized protein n=1 Tax=Talaromyces rugulosus TaxID=121627 RepID=A0A7H8RBQ0_TALRU|nr:uncharacterized protein TRUGW13939_10917 [Talaromyces rugulosus]QKX63746.1 hypothetical protein TRUGW13939_10917 [Talaromyces rugulosus]
MGLSFIKLLALGFVPFATAYDPREIFQVTVQSGDPQIDSLWFQKGVQKNGLINLSFGDNNAAFVLDGNHLTLLNDDLSEFATGFIDNDDNGILKFGNSTKFPPTNFYGYKEDLFAEDSSLLWFSCQIQDPPQITVVLATAAHSGCQQLGEVSFQYQPTG